LKDRYEDFNFQPFLCTQYSGELRPSEDNIPEFVDLDSLDNILLISDDVKDISRKWYNHHSD